MYWLLLAILLMILEGASMSLITIWFALGALSAAISVVFIDSFVVQLTVFVTVSLFALVFTRPLVKKYVTPKIVPTNVDAIVGKTGLVIEDINAISATGQVKVGGIVWSAKSVLDIPKDTTVRVCKVEGVKLIVETYKEEIA